MCKDSVIENVNSQQRAALLATLALSILVLLLHFPFDGYVSEYSYTVPSLTACPKGDPTESLRKLGAEAFNKVISACQDEYVTKELPLTEWRSSGAAIYWLAFPMHALAVVISILIIGLACFFSARQSRSPDC